MIEILVTFSDETAEGWNVHNYSISDGGVLKAVFEDGVVWLAPGTWKSVRRVNRTAAVAIA